MEGKRREKLKSSLPKKNNPPRFLLFNTQVDPYWSRFSRFYQEKMVSGLRNSFSFTIQLIFLSIIFQWIFPNAGKGSQSKSSRRRKSNEGLLRLGRRERILIDVRYRNYRHSTLGCVFFIPVKVLWPAEPNHFISNTMIGFCRYSPISTELSIGSGFFG